MDKIIVWGLSLVLSFVLGGFVARYEAQSTEVTTTTTTATTEVVATTSVVVTEPPVVETTAPPYPHIIHNDSGSHGLLPLQNLLRCVCGEQT
jgi:hypothetical protein